MHNDLQVALVGTKVDLTYDYEVQHLSIIYAVYCHFCHLCFKLCFDCILYNIYIFQHLGDTATTLKDIVSGRHAFSKVL